MTLKSPENTFQHLAIGYEVPRTQYFSYNSKIAQSGHFGLIWKYQKMSKWLVLSIGSHNHDPRARKEPLKSKRLIFEDHGLRNKI